MVTRSKLRDEVIVALLRHIEQEQLSAGDSLPPERAIAEQLGVSRTVVREGLTALEMQGLLELVPGRRPVLVRRFERAFAETLGHAVAGDEGRLRELIEVRQIFEPSAAALAARRASVEEIAAMERAVDDMAAHLDSPEGYIDADVSFHEGLVSAAGNELLADIMRPVAALLAQSRRATVGARRPPSSALAEHRGILDAIRDRDPEAARAACVAHLEATALDLEAVDRSSHPEPI